MGCLVERTDGMFGDNVVTTSIPTGRYGHKKVKDA